MSDDAQEREIRRKIIIDLHRYEALQESLEKKVEKISATSEAFKNSAEKELERISQAYDRTATLFMRLVYCSIAAITVIVTVAALLFGKSVGDFEDRMEKHLTNQEADLEGQFNLYTNKMAQILDIEVNKKFEETNINQVIDEKVEAKVGGVTTNDIGRIVDLQVNPQIELLANVFRTLNGDSEAFF